MPSGKEKGVITSGRTYLITKMIPVITDGKMKEIADGGIVMTHEKIMPAVSGEMVGEITDETIEEVLDEIGLYA